MYLRLLLILLLQLLLVSPNLPFLLISCLQPDAFLLLLLLISRHFVLTHVIPISHQRILSFLLLSFCFIHLDDKITNLEWTSGVRIPGRALLFFVFGSTSGTVL
jgi:hypothetical protein